MTFPAFPDRRDQMFGREPDLAVLTQRVANPGFTAVAARPRMGKTWLLEEAARRLGAGEGGDKFSVPTDTYLVGYHECKGEPDLLLYALADLYARWLADATMRQQARSLWQRHRQHAVTGTGQIVGELFDKIGKTTVVGEAVGSLVRDAFAGLAGVQTDLVSGGFALKPLAYDQVRELTQILHDVSGSKRIVLILDAWEKSPSLAAEHDTVTAFLSREQEDWPPCHILAGVRQPDPDKPERGDEALRVSKRVESTHHAAQVYRLPAMHLEDASERTRLLSHLRQVVPAAQHLTDERLLSLLGGNSEADHRYFPGVVERWRQAARWDEAGDPNHLARLADEAQNNQYGELDRLLGQLDGPRLRLAVRLALLPRLDTTTWPAFRELVMEGAEADDLDQLTRDGVLEAGDGAYPTYGHDTRHAAARRWFVDRAGQYRTRLHDEATHLTYALAARVEPIFAGPIAIFMSLELVALSGMSSTAAAFDVGEGAQALMAAPAILLGEGEAHESEAFETGRSAAVSGSPEVAYLIAATLFNRGVTYAQRGEEGDEGRAINDYSAVIDMPDAPTEQKARALINRGLTYARRGKASYEQRAIDDFSAVIEMPDVPAEPKARAFHNRGIAFARRGEAGDEERAIADWSSVIDLPDAPTEQKGEALVNRGRMYGQRREVRDEAHAIADLSTVIEMPDAPAKQKAEARFNRGLICAQRGHEGDQKREIADYSAVVNMPDAPAEDKARALINRGVVYAQRGKGRDQQRAIADWTTVIIGCDAPVELQADACNKRGSFYAYRREAGDEQRAIADCSVVMKMRDAPAKQKAYALINRGVCYAQRGKAGDKEREIADYSAVIDMPDAPAESKVHALFNRAVCYAQRRKAGDEERAIADYSAVIGMPDAPAEQKPNALINRGVRYAQRGEEGDQRRAIADYSAVIDMSDATAEQKAQASYNLACLQAHKGRQAEAVAALEQWRALDSEANRATLDSDADFDSIREEPEFVTFRASLPWKDTAC